MSRARHLALWRLSLLLAAALIGWTFWFIGHLALTIFALRAMAEAVFGGPAHTDWPGVALLFAILGLIGVAAPGLYLRWAWRRAFPRFPH